MQWSIISQRVLKVITRGRSSLSKMKIIILFKTSKNCTGLVSASFTQAYVRITLSLLSWPNVPSHHSFISTTIKINQLLTFILTTSTPCASKRCMCFVNIWPKECSQISQTKISILNRTMKGMKSSISEVSTCLTSEALMTLKSFFVSG